MAEHGKYCPIMVAGANTHVSECIGKDCAWWLPYANDCALPVIAGGLADSTIIGSIAPTAGRRWMDGTKVNENFEKIKDRLGEAEVLAQLAEECAELAQAALKLRRALDGKNPTPNSEEERRRALIEEYTDVVHCALVLDLEMDLDQIRKKTERWMRRLGIGEEDGN